MRAGRKLEIQKAKKAQRVNKAKASPVAAAPADNRTESQETDLEEVMVQMQASIDEGHQVLETIDTLPNDDNEIEFGGADEDESL
jgi:hypothetical protein